MIAKQEASDTPNCAGQLTLARKAAIKRKGWTDRACAVLPRGEGRFAVESCEGDIVWEGSAHCPYCARMLAIAARATVTAPVTINAPASQSRPTLRARSSRTQRSAPVNPVVGTMASRGDLFVYENERSQPLAAGGTRLWNDYELAVVTRVTRERRVKAFRLAGDTLEIHLSPRKIGLVGAERLNVAAVEAAYAARGELGKRAFQSLEEARDFLRPYLNVS